MEARTAGRRAGQRPDRSANTPETACAGAFARELEKVLGRDGLSPAEIAFIDQLKQDLASDDIAGLTPEDLAALALDFWSFAERREGDDPQVRLTAAIGAGGRDLDLCSMQIVQEDQPFLVDSVMGEATEGGYVVKAMFHP